MSALGGWATLALEGGAVLLGAAGALRLVRPARLTRDARLIGLSLFFGCFAAATAVRAAGSLYFARTLDDGAFVRDAIDLHDALFWSHHLLLLAGLAAAAFALAPRGVRAIRHAAYAPLLLWAEPALRSVETAVLLYVTVRAALHQTRRLTGASVRAAVGWTALVLAHAVFLLQNEPLGPRDPWGVALQFVGIAILVATLPWGRR